MKKTNSAKVVASALTMSLLLAACGQTAATTKPAVKTTGNDTKTTTAAAKESTTAKKERGEAKGQVIVGTTTEPTGDFATPYWKNNATDNNINGFLIGGYSTTALNLDGTFEIDKTVVKDYQSKMNDDGSKTFTYTIQDGLKYSDGTPITAKDYVASAMFFSSQPVAAAGAKIGSSTGTMYPGFDNFSKGVKDANGHVSFSGVRLLSDKQFSVTLTKDYVPTFFELSNSAVSPLPLYFWTKNDKGLKIEVKDDGQGAYFSDEFTAEAFKDTINKARKDPKMPSSGPYIVDNFDATNSAITLKVNKEYLGDNNKVKAGIETIIFKKVSKETMMDELKTGSVDILDSLMEGDQINAAMKLSDENPGKFEYVNYPRAGYGKLQFVCDFGPTQFVEVRQAIAHLLNRKEFVQQFSKGFGTIVNGPYGESQWMYKESQAELAKNLNQYAYSLDEAVKVLEAGGWTLNAEGKPYNGTGLRHKMVDGKLMPLEINWASSEKNTVSELLVTLLQENRDVTKVGMKINRDVMTFGELLNYLYRDTTESEKYGEKKYNMFNLASGFPAAYVPKDEYTTDPELLAQGNNTNFIVDKELEKLAEAYWKVDPKDKEAYKNGWVKYVEYWNKVLPDLPIYSNIIHDFYNAKIKDYENSPFVNIAYALAHAYIE